MPILMPSDLMGKNYSLPQSSMDDMVNAMESQRRAANRRFWIPVFISLIALGVSIWSVKISNSKQQLQVIRDTVRISVKQESPKIDSPKVYPTSKTPDQIKK